MTVLVYRQAVKEICLRLEYAKQIHKNIKVELKYSKSSIAFLDTNIYLKPTDKHLYHARTKCQKGP